MNEKHHANGFMFGLLLGAAVGALVSTKKGREILKDVADYGLEYVGNVINLDDLEEVMDEEGEEMSSYAKASEDKMSGEVEEPIEVKQTTTKETVQEVKPRRRLFRGIRRK